jgi:hypothetical protein
MPPLKPSGGPIIGGRLQIDDGPAAPPAGPSSSAIAPCRCACAKSPSGSCAARCACIGVADGWTAPNDQLAPASAGTASDAWPPEAPSGSKAFA